MEYAYAGLIVRVTLIVCFLAVPRDLVRAEPAETQDVVLSADFEGGTPFAGWSGTTALDSGCRSAHSMRIAAAAVPGAHGAAVRMTLPVERLRGCLLIVSAMVRAQNVSNRPQPWNGIKLMMPITHPGGTLYPQAKVGTGTFDWAHLSCAVRVPPDATGAVLHLGLEEVTGVVWFDDVRVVIARKPSSVEVKPSGRAPYTGHSVPRLRGTMISPGITPESLQTLGREWNANVIRWQLTRSTRGSDLGQDSYDRWLDGELARLDAELPTCRQDGLLVVVDLHSPPGGAASAGGYMAADADMFSSRDCQSKFVEVWQKIATRYKGAKGIWGFDLANEPIEDTLAEGMSDWPALAQRAASAIHAIDPARTIIVEAASGANPDGFSVLVPIDVPNVVYSVHMYLPHTFTHQGVFGPSKEYRYPGVIDGRMWDKAQLEKALDPVVEFQRKYGVHIYVGEFSAIRWAPDDSAYRYLRDLIDIFEKHGWDWNYHAFREWDGWSVEHGPDPADHAPSKSRTTREELLRSWFARNRKPGR